jgi:hypothetical protein
MQVPGVFFDNEWSTFALPAELVGRVAEVVAGVEELDVAGVDEKIGVKILRHWSW